jgi:uncharacterized protein (DUF2062 family)
MKFRTFRWFHRRGLSRRKLRGKWLHRLLGERVVGKGLWAFRRDSVARGWLLGCLVATTPLLGVHLLMGVPLALLTRSNLLVVIALLMTTNPLTAGIFYPFAFLVGCWTLGNPVSDYQLSHSTVWHAGGPLLLGCALIGALTGLTGWLLIRWLWRGRAAGKGNPERVTIE